jgi:hypothetical protein
VGKVVPLARFSVVTATGADDDIIEVTQAGASGGRIQIQVDGSADVESGIITASGTGYYLADDLGVTKVSGSGTVHSAIRFDLKEGDVNNPGIFFKDGYELAEGDTIIPVIKTNALAILKGDPVAFDSTNGGYNYQYFLPGAGATATVLYG